MWHPVLNVSSRRLVCVIVYKRFSYIQRNFSRLFVPGAGKGKKSTCGTVPDRCVYFLRYFAPIIDPKKRKNSNAVCVFPPHVTTVISSLLFLGTTSLLNHGFNFFVWKFLFSSALCTPFFFIFSFRFIMYNIFTPTSSLFCPNNSAASLENSWEKRKLKYTASTSIIFVTHKTWSPAAQTTLFLRIEKQKDRGTLPSAWLAEPRNVLDTHFITNWIY